MAKEVVQGISVVIGGETIEFQRGMKDVNDELKATNTQLRNNAKLTKAYGKDVDTLGKKQQLLSKKIALVETATKEYEKELKDLGNLNEITSDKERKRYRQLERLIDNNKTELRLLEKQANDTEKELDQLSKADVDVKIDGDDNLTKKLSSATGELKDIDGRKATAELELDSGQFERAIQSAESELDSLSGAVAGVVGGVGAQEVVSQGLSNASTGAFAEAQIRGNITADDKQLDASIKKLVKYGQAQGVSKSATLGAIASNSAYVSSLEELEKWTKTAIDNAQLWAIKEGEPLAVQEQLITSQESLKDAINTGSITAIEDSNIAIDEWIKRLEKSGYLTEQQISEIKESEIGLNDQAEAMFKLLDPMQRLELLSEQYTNEIEKMNSNLDLQGRSVTEAGKQWNTFTSNIQDSFGRIATALSPFIAGILGFLNQFPIVIDLAVGLATALGTLLSVLGGFAIFTKIATFVGSFTQLGAVLSAIGTGLATIGTTLAGLISWPVVLIGVLIALLYNFWDEFVLGLKIVIQALAQFGSYLKQLFTELFQFIKDWSIAKLQEIITFILSIPSRISSALASLQSAFTNTFSAIASAITSSIGSAIDWAVGKLQSFLGFASSIGNSIRSGFSSVASAINPFDNRSFDYSTTTNNKTDIYVSDGGRTRKATRFEKLKFEKGLVTT